jgi:hypothetical protein
MPHTDAIPDRALDVVANEVAPRLPRLLGSRLLPTTTVVITSSFEVWGLSTRRISKSSSDNLDPLATPTGRWHHQIALDGQPELYARSLPALEAEGWTVGEVALSPTARLLDAAIDWIDANVAEDYLARLLEAPAYHLLAIWLVGAGGQGRVLVVEAASRLADLVGPQLRPESELLRRLRAVKPVVGIELA